MGRPSKYPFKTMKDGDVIPLYSSGRQLFLEISAARNWACKNGWKMKFVQTNTCVEVIRLCRSPDTDWRSEVKKLQEGEVWESKELDLNDVAKEVHMYGRAKNKRFVVTGRKGIVRVQRVSLEEEAKYWNLRRTTHPFENLGLNEYIESDWQGTRAVVGVNKHGRARYSTRRVGDKYIITRIA